MSTCDDSGEEVMYDRIAKRLLLVHDSHHGGRCLRAMSC